MAGRPDARGKREPTLAARLLWFAILWLAGVATVALLALAVRQLSGIGGQ
jgi:hypothetical protein